MTEVVYLSIKNTGSLALKYKVAVNVTHVSTHALTDVMQYAITPDATYGQVTSWDKNSGISVNPGVNDTAAEGVALLPGENGDGEEHFFALSVHMLEEATNEYMGETITFDIKVLAGQYEYEEDSFGTSYDEFAGYPGNGFAPAISGNETAAEIRIVGDDGYKVGSVVIPKDATDPDAEQYTASIKPTNYRPNVTIESNMTVTAYEITVDGLKENNNEPVKVQLKLNAGMDPATVKVYHHDQLVVGVPATENTPEIPAPEYNPNTGYVTFYTTSFSPFTLVYDANSQYVAPVVPEGMARPTATVTYEPEYVGPDKITWGSYGQWSPTEGLAADLEAAFTFKCPENLDPEIREVFEFWHCDFYVSLDRALGENQIFLGGNYGSFGWVGFHNGNLTLEANEEVALLGSVTSNPWTYSDVERNVGEFICGVGHVGTALDSATFTVKLRLTNPTDSTEFYDVNVVTYTFGGNVVIDGVTHVTTADGLRDAVENGDSNITLEGDIDLSEGLVIPGN